MAKASSIFECTACGARHPKAMGRCTACGAWDAVLEVRGSLKRDLQRAGSAYAQSHYAGPVAMPDVDVTDTHRTPTGLVELDRVLGMSILSGAHNQIFPEVLRLLKAQGADDVMVFAGGIIPDEDIPALKAAGIREVFQPGTNTDDIVAFIRDAIQH